MEGSPVESNDNQPLNAGRHKREYIVICTHCHFDHINGIEQFSIPDGGIGIQRATIVASARGRSFIENDLPEHSICKYVGIPTPRYTVSVWAEDFERLTYPLEHACMDMEASQFLPASASDLGITIINTPGHTPDELAWYDHNERHLYVGDSFYEEGEDFYEEGKEGMAILFPKDGNWLDYMQSMHKLLDFVRRENAAVAEDSDGWLSVPKRVKVGCGHGTISVDGETIVKEVIQLFGDIIMGKVPVQSSEVKRDEIYDYWRQEGKNVKFSVSAPRRLCEDARKVLPRKEPSRGTLLGNTGLSGLFRKLPFGQ